MRISPVRGRTLFGGLQAVVGLAAMRSLAPEAPLRSLQVTFLAPVPGGPVRAHASILRSGKSATHVEARIVDGDNTLALDDAQLHPALQGVLDRGRSGIDRPDSVIELAMRDRGNATESHVLAMADFIRPSAAVLASLPRSCRPFRLAGTCGPLVRSGRPERVGHLEVTEAPAVLQVLAREDITTRIERRLDDEAVPSRE